MPTNVQHHRSMHRGLIEGGSSSLRSNNRFERDLLSPSYHLTGSSQADTGQSVPIKSDAVCTVESELSHIRAKDGPPAIILVTKGSTDDRV